MPALLEALLQENGHNAQVFSVTCGARKLVDNITLQDEYSQRLEELAQSHTFDCVFLQDQSLISIRDFERFKAGVTGLSEKLAPCARKFILYATWGRKEGSPDLAPLGLTQRTMTEQISAAYRQAASLIRASIAPVGEAFAALDEKLDLYNPDLSHPSYAGSCLAAVMLYTALLGAPPKTCPAWQLDPDRFAAMAETAASLCGK